MAVYVVTWNLNREKSNYNQARDAFLKHLDTYDNTRDSGLETVRWISTAQTATQVSDFLQQKLDSNDRLFVSRVRSGERAGWIDKTVWPWIRARE